MTVLDRFLNYVSFETTAGEEKPDRCSDEKMLLLADSLMQELFRLHPDSISINRFGVIDCHFKGDENKKAVAFLAHMDTSPQASGKNVRARVVKYEGQDIVLSEGRVLSEKEFQVFFHQIESLSRPCRRFHYLHITISNITVRRFS